MLKNLSELSKLLFATLLTVAIGSTARAAEVKFLCATALKPAMDQLINDFQRTNGHKINVSYANIGIITDRVRKGEIVDLAVTSPQQWTQLDREGKLASDFRVQFAKVGVGVAIKKGGEKPDLSSVPALKSTLLKARAVAITNPATGSPSGAYVMRLFDRLGISDEMKSRSKLVADNVEMFNAVANGEADFGITQGSLIAAALNVELAGPLPTELQNFTIFIASIPKTASQSEAAKSLVKFLTTPDAAAVLKSKGLEPG